MVGMRLCGCLICWPRTSPLRLSLMLLRGCGAAIAGERVPRITGLFTSLRVTGLGMLCVGLSTGRTDPFSALVVPLGGGQMRL